MKTSLKEHQTLTKSLLNQNEEILKRFYEYKKNNSSLWNEDENKKAKEIEKDLLVCLTTSQFYLKFFEENVPMSSFDEEVFLDLTKFMTSLFKDLDTNLPSE